MNLAVLYPESNKNLAIDGFLDDDSLKAIQSIIREGESQNTVNSYKSAIQYWSVWFELRYGQKIKLPLSANQVMQFMVDHVLHQGANGLVCLMPETMDQKMVEMGAKTKLGALSHNTVVHRLAVLSKIHQIQGFNNPCQDPKVKELLAKSRKAYAKRGVLAAKKDAITKDPLEAMLATCDDSLKGKRDKALLLFAWASGGRRRSEVTQADMQFLKTMGPNEYIYYLFYSKTNQSGVDKPENAKPIVGKAGKALNDWLTSSQITTGAIFRRIRKGGHLGTALSPAAVRDIVLERSQMAGLSGNFSAHSLRSGFVTEAGKQNIPLGETMAMTGHQSTATVLGYFRAEQNIQSKAARLFDDEAGS
jgi:integrase